MCLLTSAGYSRGDVDLVGRVNGYAPKGGAEGATVGTGGLADLRRRRRCAGLGWARAPAGSGGVCHWAGTLNRLCPVPCHHILFTPPTAFSSRRVGRHGVPGERRGMWGSIAALVGVDCGTVGAGSRGERDGADRASGIGADGAAGSGRMGRAGWGRMGERRRAGVTSPLVRLVRTNCFGGV